MTDSGKRLYDKRVRNWSDAGMSQGMPGIGNSYYKLGRSKERLFPRMFITCTTLQTPLFQTFRLHNSEGIDFCGFLKPFNWLWQPRKVI
jgi:hypothetical protein